LVQYSKVILFTDDGKGNSDIDIVRV